MCSFLPCLAISVPTTSWLLGVSYSLVILSLFVTFASVMRRMLLKGLQKIAKRTIGDKWLPSNWKSTGIFSSDLRDPSKNSSEWISGWKDKWRGRTPVLSTIRILPWFGLMLIFTLVLPAAQKVENNTTTVTHICLPHIEAETDQYHWTMDSFCKGDPALFTDTVFCESGFEPPWQEGQTIKWYRFRREPTCQVLLGYEGQRDKNHNIVNW